LSTPNLLVRLAITLVVIWLAGREGIPGAVAQTGDVAVVVNDKNPVDNLSRPELRKIFAGEKRSWPGSLPIKLFVRTPGARERATLLRLLGMSESEYKEYWTAKVFRGEAQTEWPSLERHAEGGHRGVSWCCGFGEHSRREAWNEGS
jgi:hypothetical protein